MAWEITENSQTDVDEDWGRRSQQCSIIEIVDRRNGRTVSAAACNTVNPDRREEDSQDDQDDGGNHGVGVVACYAMLCYALLEVVVDGNWCVGGVCSSLVSG